MKRSSPDSSRRALLVAGILLGALALQIAFLFIVLPKPTELFWPDPNHYYAIAKGLYEGGPYSDAATEWNLYRSPGYPFLLSLIMHGVGTSVLGIRLVCIALSVPFLLILYRLGTVLGNDRTGWLALLLAAVYPLYVYLPVTLYPESVLLGLFAGIGLLLFYTRDARHSLLLVLLLSGLISLTVMVRPTAVVWVPVSLFYLTWRNGWPAGRIAGAAALLVLIPALCVVSWMYRNYRVHGCAIFTTAGSINLVNCYNEQATGRKADSGVDAEFERQLAQEKTVAVQEEMRMARVKAFVRAHPGQALQIALQQCLDLWNPLPTTRTQSGMAQTKYKIFVALGYVPVLLLGLYGLVVSRKNLFVQSLLLLLVLNTLANGIVAVSVRYRAVTDFVLILMAARALSVRTNSPPMLPDD